MRPICSQIQGLHAGLGYQREKEAHMLFANFQLAIYILFLPHGVEIDLVFALYG